MVQVSSARSLLDAGGVLRPGRTSAHPIPGILRTIDLRSLAILRRPSDPITLLHLQKSEGSSSGLRGVSRGLESSSMSLVHLPFLARSKEPCPR